MNPICPHCNQPTSTKNGTSRGRQRWKCKPCNKTFTENPKPRGGSKKDEEITRVAETYGISRDAARKRIARANGKTLK